MDKRQQLKKKWREVEVRNIIKNSKTPLLDLQGMGYDFHQAFEDIFGVRPPPEKFKFHSQRRDLEIDLGDKIILGIDIGAEGVIEPFIYAEVDVGDERGMNADQMGFYPEWTDDGKENMVPTGDMQVKHDIYNKKSETYVDEELEEGVSISKLPAILGAWPELELSTHWPQLGGNVTEGKIDRNYLFEAINEVLQEDDEEEDNLFYDLLQSKKIHRFKRF